jgi:hypothetical protein
METQSVSVTPEHVKAFLRKGAKPETVTRLLVATGAWSESGAEEIVSTLAPEPVDAAALAQEHEIPHRPVRPESELPPITPTEEHGPL